MKRTFSNRVNEWLGNEQAPFQLGVWRFWFVTVAGLQLLSALLTALIFSSAGNLENHMGAILLGVGALVGWIAVGCIHYSNSSDRVLARGVSALDSVTLLFVIAHFCILTWVYGHLKTIQADEARYTATVEKFNVEARQIQDANVKIAEAAQVVARETTKAERLRNDAAYQLRKAAEAGARGVPRSAVTTAPSSGLQTSQVELERPKAPEETSAQFMKKWDGWIRMMNFGELLLCALTMIFIRNRSAATITSGMPLFGVTARAGGLQPRFDGEASRGSKTASVGPGEASPDGLRELQEICSEISFRHPGRWYAVDLRADHVRVRLRARQNGREVTIRTARLTLDVLRDVRTMDRETFTLRFTDFLRKRSFEI